MSDVADMRGVLVQQFESRLRSLPRCSRCADDRCEKCLDQGLVIEEQISVDDVTCGCGCCSYGLYRIQLGLDDEPDFDDDL